MTNLQELILTELVNNYEFACLHCTPFAKTMDCPNYTPNNLGVCIKDKDCPSPKDYFKKLLEREVI